MKKRIYLVLIVFSAVRFTIYIGVFIIRLPFPENILLIFFLFIVCGVSLWIIFIYTAIDRYRKLVFKDQHSRIYYVGRKYDDNILIERLERWNNSRYELGDDKKSEHLNKSIYKLEERVRKLFKKAKYQDALVITEQIFKIVKENYDRLILFIH